MFSDHNEIKLEISSMKISGKIPKYVETENTNNPQIKEEIRRKIRKYFHQKQKCNMSKVVRCC